VNAALACPSCSDTTFGGTPDRKGKRRGCVAVIVKPDIRQTSFSQKWLEMLFDQVLLVDWRAMSRSENQIGERRGAGRSLIRPASQLPE